MSAVELVEGPRVSRRPKQHRQQYCLRLNTVKMPHTLTGGAPCNGMCRHDIPADTLVIMLLRLVSRTQRKPSHRTSGTPCRARRPLMR